MKKIFIAVCLICLISSARAQLYIHLNSGYSVSTQPDIRQNRVITDNTIDLFRIKFSYGNGLNLGIGAGYKFSEHFFAELNAVTTFFSRSRSENNWEYFFKREYSKLHLTGLNGDVLIRNTSIQLAPMIGYSVSAGKFSPFLKAGLNILYLKSRYENNYTYKYFESGTGWYLENTDVKRRTDGGIQLGFRGTAGILYRLSEKLMLMVDLTAVNAMYRFDVPETLSFKVDGVEKVDETVEDLKEETVDFSNIGLNVGIRYNFGK